jgi:cytochrome P450
VEIAFDHHTPIRLSELYDLFDHLVTEKPIAWNTAHGGYWVISGFDLVSEVYSDWERFSSLHDGVDDDPFAQRDVGHYPEHRTPRKGFAFPEAPSRFVPTECDPPMHTDIRRLEAPFFSPKAVRTYEDGIRRHTTEALDAVIDRGEVDFASFVATVTTQMTCKLLGVGEDAWPDFAATVRAIGLTGFGDPNFPMDRFRATQEQILQLCTHRSTEPQDDVASALMRGSVLGEPLTPPEGQTILNGLTFGSTDTTNTTTLHALIFLSDNLELRDQLRADPALLPQAVEEFLRLFTPSLGAGRTVTADLDFHGFAFREGDRVQVLNGAANRDPRKFPKPREFDLARENLREHLAFGGGPHKCLGAPIGRMEMRIMLEEILRRLPDFQIARGELVEYPTKSGVLGYDKVPATFTSAPAATSARS